ncbi:TPA: hypothetical protein CPT90_09975 [Candidatus Gastranaerophilales bacterium HUM_3]|nr:MAG: hypothetical protein BHW62_06410 [Acinetobacter sp. CAG:196_36_41]DAA81663.1 MAG TPA: hypothetical protein CPT90_09975 [Candidatus Gastranaerophilales bacterium HUM_3]DAB07580.1 MAG TPA: hypothetical protein CPT95_08620 [Candidatus Gastranaerophilales bacterium HUM_15]
MLTDARKINFLACQTAPVQSKIDYGADVELSSVHRLYAAEFGHTPSCRLQVWPGAILKDLQKCGSFLFYDKL